MTHYTDIFFDFDDTLYDTQSNSFIALRKLYDERHWNEIMPPFEEFDKAYVATNVKVWTEYTNGEIDRDTLIVERFRDPVTAMIEAEDGDISWITPKACLEMSNRYGDIISQEPRIVNGADELLACLKDKGYKLHLCSNGFHEVQYRKLRSSGLEMFFSTVILSEDTGINKPHKGFFDYAFHKTGAKPETTIMIGDNYRTDIVGAMNVNIDTILFNRWKDDVASFVKQPTFVVDKLIDIKEILI